MPITSWTLVSGHIRDSYPWTQSPLITNAPMGSVAGPALVAEVTRARGLGFLGAGYSAADAEKKLVEARKLISNLKGIDHLPTDDTLPVGLGVLCFIISLDDTLRLVKEHKPVAVWLFAAHETSDYTQWARAIRDARPGTKIWVQTNTVHDALQLARETKPDVLVMQGGDAGGHGGEQSASIVSLVPEAADALARESFAQIPLIAAGGIADGRGVAGALALGAAGATLGTRFLASEEATMAAPGYQKAILAATDGGQSTLKDKVFDDLNAEGNIWPKTYNARGLRNASSKDSEAGVGIEENRKKFAEGSKVDGGYKASMEESRANAWAGTGVGLVRKVDKAYDIVMDCRASAKRILTTVGSRL